MVVEMIVLRPAKLEDSRKVWEWRNDPVTRESAVNTKKIPWREHEKWFEKKLASKTTEIFIIEDEPTKKPVGVVRVDYDEKNKKGEVSVNIAPSERGKGYGSRAVKKLVELENKKKRRNVRKLFARIKKRNLASEKAFENAGFVRTNKIIKGPCLEYFEISLR